MSVTVIPVKMMLPAMMVSMAIPVLVLQDTQALTVKQVNMSTNVQHDYLSLVLCITLSIFLSIL